MMVKDWAKMKKDIESQIISLSWKIGKGWKKDPRIIKLQAKKRQINTQKNLESWGLK
jgi:hypothetical protein